MSNRIIFNAKPMILVLLGALLLFGIGTGATEQADYKTVVAEGVAALVPGKAIDRAHDEAIKDAKRNAVQIGLGVLLDSQTIVENYQVISDSILTRSAGYVRGFEVVSRSREDDLYRVVISAEVALVDIQGDLLAVHILKREKGYPRLMLVGVEKLGDEEKGSVSAQTAIEEILIESGFDLVDESQVEVLKARDAAMHPDDPGLAAALGKRLGAEVIIVFQAMADYEGASNAYGLTLHSFRGTVDATIIYTDTADILDSVSASDYAAAEGRPAAVRLAFQKTAKKVAPLIVERILDDWQKHTNKLELIISGLTYREMKQLKERIQMMRRVKAVAAPKFEKGVAIFHIQADLSAEEFADKLLDGKEFPGLDIEAMTPGRVEAMIHRTPEKP